jgi:hypothetical protein
MFGDIRRRCFLGGVVWLATLPVTSPAGPERFYYQDQWGTRTFQLLRAPDGGLNLAIQQQGTYAFAEDGLPVDGWDALEADWAHLANVDIFPVIYDFHGGMSVARSPAREGKNKWVPADFVLAPGASQAGAPRDIFRVGWKVHASAGATGELKGCQLLLPPADSGGSFPLFADHAKPYPIFLPPPAAAPENRPKTPAPATAARVFVAENSLLFGQPDWLQALIPWAKAKFPNEFGVDMGYLLWSGSRQTVDAYRQGAGAYTIFEGHKVMPEIAWLRNNHLSLTRADGFSPADPIWPAAEIGHAKALSYHEDDTTQPAVMDLARARVDAAFDEDFDNFMLIDYIWPYFGGRWGYAPATVAQWKKFLQGHGATIDLVDPDETWGFADYWKHFVSIPLQPAEFGWTSWDAFTCGTEAEAQGNALGARRLLLFNALWHFQYLVVADQLGREGEARNREFGVTINPEDAHNGGDVNLLGRLKHLGVVGFEFFGSPLKIEAWRHVLPWLRYRSAGPQVDMVGEINAGGHNGTRYDRETAFAFYYDSTAAALPRFYDNQYQEALWQHPPVSPAQLARLNHWYGGARAFLLRREEAAKIQEQPPNVTVVASRSVLDYEDSSTSSLAQGGNLGPYLHALNIDFEQVGRDVWTPQRDQHTQVLFFCPAMASSAEWARVKEWISTGKGRTLVLQGGDAWKDDAHPEHPLPDAAAANGALVPLASRRENVAIHLKGAALQTSVWEAKTAQQTLLKSDEGVPLLTSWPVGANKVLHIQAELSSHDVSEVGLQIVADAAKQSGLAPFAQPAPDWSVDRSLVAGGEVAILWNTVALKAQGLKNYYARVPLPHPESVVLQVQPQKSYTIYSVFEDRQTEETSGPDGQLPVAVSSSTDVLYYGLNSGPFNATVLAAKQAYLDVRQESDEAMRGAK